MVDKKALTWAFVVVSASVLTAASPSSSSAPLGRVVGQVVNSDTGVGVRGATVTFERAGTRAFTTDPDGFFDAGELDPGAYEVVVSRACYQDVMTLLDVVPATSGAQDVTWSMAPLSNQEPPPLPPPRRPAASPPGCPDAGVDLGMWWWTPKMREGEKRPDHVGLFREVRALGVRSVVIYGTPHADVHYALIDTANATKIDERSCPVKVWATLPYDSLNRYQACRDDGHTPCECEAELQVKDQWGVSLYQAGPDHGVLDDPNLASGVEGWYLDEPYTTVGRPHPWTPAVVKEVVRWATAVDNRPWFIAVGQDRPGDPGPYIPDWAEVGDVLSAAWYPKELGNPDFAAPNYPFQRDIADRMVASHAPCRYMHTQMQGPTSGLVGDYPPLASPTFDELLWQIANPVLRGVQGVYLWWAPHSTEDASTDRDGQEIKPCRPEEGGGSCAVSLWDATRQALEELVVYRFWDILFKGGRGANVSHDGGAAVDVATRYYDRHDYLVVTNIADEDRTVTFWLNGMRRFPASVTEMRSGPPDVGGQAQPLRVALRNGRVHVVFSDTLLSRRGAKGSLRIYRLDPLHLP